MKIPSREFREYRTKRIKALDNYYQDLGIGVNLKQRIAYLLGYHNINAKQRDTIMFEAGIAQTVLAWDEALLKKIKKN